MEMILAMRNVAELDGEPIAWRVWMCARSAGSSQPALQETLPARPAIIVAQVPAALARLGGP